MVERGSSQRESIHMLVNRGGAPLSSKTPSQHHDSSHVFPANEKDISSVRETDLSDDDDAEERLDCVHDIHSQRREQKGRTSILKQQDYEQLNFQDEAESDPNMVQLVTEGRRVVDDFEDEYDQMADADDQTDMLVAIEDGEDLVETERRGQQQHLNTNSQKLVVQKSKSNNDSQPGHGHPSSNEGQYINNHRGGIAQRPQSDGMDHSALAQSQTFDNTNTRNSHQNYNVMQPQQISQVTQFNNNQQQFSVVENRRSRSKQNEPPGLPPNSIMYNMIMSKNGQASSQQSELQRKTLQNFNNRSNKSLNPSPVTATGHGSSSYGIDDSQNAAGGGTGGYKQRNKKNAAPIQQRNQISDNPVVGLGKSSRQGQRHEVNQAAPSEYYQGSQQPVNSSGEATYNLSRNQSAHKASSRGGPDTQQTPDFNTYQIQPGQAQPTSYLATTTQYGTKYLSGVVPAAAATKPLVNNTGYHNASSAQNPPNLANKNITRFALTQNNFYHASQSASSNKHPQFNIKQNDAGGVVLQPASNNFNIRQGMRQQVRSRQKTSGVHGGPQTPVHSQGGAGQQNQPLAGNPYDNFNASNQTMMEAGRNTFYATDRQKLSLVGGKPESRGSNRQHTGGLGNPPNFGAHSATRQSAQHAVVPQQIGGNFSKPRALSRQADAHIKIEVHRDAKIYNYLQAEKQENMNLMFYDFNGSSAQNTQENFYNPNAVPGEKGETRNGAGESRGGPAGSNPDGDRVPTRERGGYRSANLNYRRRGGQTSTDRMLVQSDLMPPSGL